MGKHILALFVAAWLHSTACATTILYRSFDDLVREAEAIVSARVTDVQSVRGFDARIYTFVTVSTASAIKGQTPNPLTVRILGGRVGDAAMLVGGAPTFVVGDEVLLFVAGNGRYMVPFVGWTQGVFHLVRTSLTSEPIVVDYDGNRVFGVKDGHLVKDRNRASTLNVVGGDAVGLKRSELPLITGDEQAVAAKLPAMTLNSFIASIMAMQSKGDIAPNTVPVSSVSPGQLPPATFTPSVPPSPK